MDCLHHPCLNQSYESIPSESPSGSELSTYRSLTRIEAVAEKTVAVSKGEDNEVQMTRIRQAVVKFSKQAIKGHPCTYVSESTGERMAAKYSMDKDATKLTVRAYSKDGQTNAAKFLEEQATQQNNQGLAVIAQRATKDSLGRVRKMVQDTIKRVNEAAQGEAELEGSRAIELAVNEQARKEKSESVEKTQPEIDQLNASIAKLDESISEISKAAAELDDSIAKATEVRQRQKEKNEETIKDAQDAQNKVGQAITILKELYTKAGEATSGILQSAIFDSPQKDLENSWLFGCGGPASCAGTQCESTGIIGMLEVIQGDFERLEFQTEAAEKLAQKDHEHIIIDLQANRAAKQSKIAQIEAMKQDESNVLARKMGARRGTQDELDAAVAYIDKLMEDGVSYDDRNRRRKEEIEALQEALRILDGEVVTCRLRYLCDIYQPETDEDKFPESVLQRVQPEERNCLFTIFFNDEIGGEQRFCLIVDSPEAREMCLQSLTFLAMYAADKSPEMTSL